jgi:hypothetical protein
METLVSMLNVHAACICIPLLQVHAARPVSIFLCCKTMLLHVHIPWPCYISMLHVYAAVHAACLMMLHDHTTCPGCMFILHVQPLVLAACPCVMNMVHD